jgi:large subunit ribosomal protein L15
MNLTDIAKITTKSKKRVGQGHGSGRGKTSGRGTKGQLARHKSRLDFDGDANPLIRRLPFLRGKGRNKTLNSKPIIINLHQLDIFASGEIVDLDSLIKKNLVKSKPANEFGIKILGEGEIKKPLTLKLRASKSAALKIEKAGGKIEIVP